MSDPEVGLAGVVQLDSDGQIYPTIRRFPNALRALGGAFGGERLPIRPRWLLERELDLKHYERETRLRLDIGVVHVRAA